MGGRRPGNAQPGNAADKLRHGGARHFRSAPTASHASANTAAAPGHAQAQPEAGTHQAPGASADAQNDRAAADCAPKPLPGPAGADARRDPLAHAGSHRGPDANACGHANGASRPDGNPHRGCFAHTNGHTGRDPDPRAQPNGYGNCGPDSYPVANRNAGGYPHSSSDGDSGRDARSVSHSCGDAHTDAGSGTVAFAVAYSISCAGPYPNTHGHAGPGRHAHANGQSITNAGPRGIAHPNAGAIVEA